MKKLLLLFLTSAAFASPLYAQYTNFKAPPSMPAGLQKGSFSFQYNCFNGSSSFGGQVSGPYSLQNGLNDLNHTINTITFNGEPVFGTATLKLECQNHKKSILTVGPDQIQQVDQWITLEVPNGCG